MAKPYIMPLGFIDRITQDETVFLLTNPEDSKTIGAGTPVTVWRYSQEHLALGKARGLITAVGYTTATFAVGETSTDSRWPDDMGVLSPKAPVFLAQEDSFEPDPSRAVTPEKAEAFRKLATRYAESVGPTGQGRGGCLEVRKFESPHWQS